MKKSVSIILCVALMVSVLFVLPASAATNSNKNVVRPVQYTSVGPNDSGITVVYKETFDGVSSPEAAGYFPGYLDYGDQPAYFIPACDLTLVSGHSGKGLKISNRQQVYGQKSKSGKISQLDHTGGEFSFVMTNNYPKKGTKVTSDKYIDSNSNFLTAYEQVSNTGGGKDIGSIIGKYVSDVTDRQDVSLFFSMWVYSDTAQTVLPKIQYMGTNELWIPADDYWEVPAKKWTQVGAIVDNGKTYYCSLVGEGGSEAYGIYGSMPATTESKFCMATKSKDAAGNVSFTHGDYIIDDITIWQVKDKSKLYDMQYTMTDKSVYTGLKGLVENIKDNKDNIASKKVVNAFNVPKPTTKKTAAPTKKPVVTKAPTTSIKVVKETNKAGKVIGTKKVVVTEAAATATGTGTETGTATGTGTGTEATVTATATETVVNTAAETTATDASGEPTEPEEKGSLLWLWILLGVVVVGGGTGAGIALSKKKGAPAEEAAEEAPAEETPSDDAE